MHLTLQHKSATVISLPIFRASVSESTGRNESQLRGIMNLYLNDFLSHLLFNVALRFLFIIFQFSFMLRNTYLLLTSVEFAPFFHNHFSKSPQGCNSFRLFSFLLYGFSARQHALILKLIKLILPTLESCRIFSN